MKNKKPTDREFDILKILWGQGPSSVQEVHQKIFPNQESGYTTTLKLMQIMFEKKLITRHREGKKHIYEANVSREVTERSLLDKLKETAFGGSASSLVMRALGSAETSKEELKEIKKFIDELERKK